MKRRTDTIILALGLFTLSGAVLCYNLVTMNGNANYDAVQASALPSGDCLSIAAENALTAAKASPDDSEIIEEVILLPPVVRPD